MKARKLIWPAVLLAMLASGAVVLDWFERNKESPELLGRTVLGDVTLYKASLLLIETHQGQVTLRRGKTGWTIDEQGGFPADNQKIRNLMVGLAKAELTQQMRVRADQLGDLGLLQKVENDWRHEAGRTAAVLSIIQGLEHKHRLLYQVLIGNRREGAGTYVRFPESRRAYLVAEDLQLDGDPEHWIYRRIFREAEAADMQAIRVRHGGRPPLSVMRPNEGSPWVAHPPESRLEDATAHALATAVAELRIAGVTPPQSTMIPDVASGGAVDGVLLEVRFFDGRRVTLRLGPAAAPEGLRRGTLVAEAERRGETAVHERTQAFNGRFAGRTVAVEASEAQRLLAPTPRPGGSNGTARQRSAGSQTRPGGGA